MLPREVEGVHGPSERPWARGLLPLTSAPYRPSLWELMSQQVHGIIEQVDGLGHPTSLFSICRVTAAAVSKDDGRGSGQ